MTIFKDYSECKKIKLSQLRKNLDSDIWETDEGELLHFKSLTSLHLANLINQLNYKINKRLIYGKTGGRTIIYVKYLNIFERMKKEV
jgi:hypothetical protein